MGQRWQSYCESQSETEIVRPILLIQVEDGTKKKVSATDLEAVLKAVRDEVAPAHPNGVMPEPKASHGVRLSSYDVEPSHEVIANLNRLIEAGPFEVHIARTFPLDRAAEAHRALDDHYLGKLALRLS